MLRYIKRWLGKDDFKPPEPLKRHSLSVSWSYIKKVLPIIKPLKKHVFLMSAYAFLTAFVGLVIPFTPKIIIDIGYANRDFGIIFSIVLMILIISIFSGLLNLATGYYSYYLKSYTAYISRNAFLKKIVRLNEEDIINYRSGDLIARSGGLQSGIKFIIESIVKITTLIVRMMVIPFALLILDWRLIAIGLPVILIVSLGWYYIQKVLRSFDRKYAIQKGNQDSSLYDITSSFSDLRLSGQSKKAVHRYMKEYVKTWRTGAISHLISSLFSTGQSIVMAVATFFINIFGWSLVVSGEWSLGKMATILIAFGYLTMPIQSVIELYDRMVGVSIQTQRYFEIFDIDNRNDNSNPDSLSKTIQPDTIKCENISFSYPHGPEILKSCNAMFKKGQITAITGDSGCGKSTLLKIISGILAPKTGIIQAGNIDLQTVDKDSWFKSVSFLTQKPFFFSASITENILFDENTNKESLDHILTICNLKKRADELCGDSIGEGGRGLSGGERQRLAMCRFLANLNDVLLLDEPLSMVDNKSVESIFKNIEDRLRSRLTILVTHNPLLLEFADKTYSLYHGELYEN